MEYILRFLNILILLIFFHSLSADSTTSYLDTKIDIDALMQPNNKVLKSELEKPLQEHWDSLLIAKTCYWGLPHGKPFDESISRTRHKWTIKAILNYPKEELTSFLISKSTSKTSTQIHFCDSYEANEGLVAFSLLQIALEKRWNDYTGQNKELNELIKNHNSMTSENFNPIYKENHCIARIVADDSLRAELIKFLIDNN